MQQRAANCILERAGTETTLATQLLGIPTSGTRLAATDVVSAMTLYQLLLLNIVLQIFDGIATYNGVGIGLKEANPLLSTSFAVWGIGPTLLLFKSGACALLLLLYWRPAGVLVVWGYVMLAALYYVCSVVPWLAAYGTLFVRYL